MMMNNQMELGFNKTRTCMTVKQRQRRMSRAQWWFKQMRRAVDCAIEWKPSPNARPQQVHMKLSPRW
jgi:hypothetical protein